MVYPDVDPVMGIVPGGMRIWAGSLVVTGPISSVQSGVEFIHLLSQPVFNSAPAIVPPFQMIRFAQVFGDFHTASTWTWPTIASGGIPDAISGGREALSNIAAAGAVGGPVIGVQWRGVVTSTAGLQVAANPAGFFGNASSLVSGQTIGAIVIGY